MNYLIFGGKGQLGSRFEEVFTLKGINFTSYDYDTCDIADIDSVMKIVRNDKPNIILNCAAYNLVDEAEKSNHTAYKVNHLGTHNIALAANETRAFLVHYSTDYVFDGTKGEHYVETDETNPLNEYGKSKLQGEKSVQEILDEYLIFRLSWVYGNGQQNFIHKFKQWATTNRVLNITENEYSIPSSVDLISDGTINSISKNITGICHLVPSGLASRLDWANEIVKLYNLDVKINPVQIESFNLPAKRPLNSAMNNKKLSSLIGDFPDWKESMSRFTNGI